MPTKLKTPPPPLAPAGGKLAAVIELLRRDGGATIAALMAATGWKQHSVRGALAGAVKKKGFTVVSQKPAEVRVYRIAAVEEVR